MSEAHPTRDPLDSVGAPGSAPRRHRAHAVVFATFFFVFALWSAAVPMYGTPDEPAHMVRAAGIVRGQVDGDLNEDRRYTYDVPAILNSQPGCYAFKKEATADCLVIPADVGEASVVSTANSYPPLFHLLVGWPTLLVSGLKSLYFMRLANALACAAMVTAAFANIRALRRPGPVALGLAVSLTPMVLFLSGPVNPSGIAATSGLAVWTAAFVLLDRESTRSLPHAAAAFAVPFCALVLVRRDSLIWAFVIVVVLALMLTRERLTELARSAAVWAWGVVILVTVAAQYLLWTGDNASGFSSGATASGGGSAARAFGQGFRYLFEAIGIMGWLDTNMPSVVYHGWMFLLLSLLVALLALGRARELFVLLVAIALLLAVPTYIGSVRFPYFQGRYYLPFAVGIPMLAGHGLAQVSAFRLPRRVLLLGLGAMFLLHQVAFAQQIRRYAVGTSGTWWFPFDHEWSPPPAPIWLLMALYLVAVGAMLWRIVDVGALVVERESVSSAEPQSS